MFSHGVEEPVNFIFEFPTVGTLKSSHSAHFVSSGASRQRIDWKPGSVTELVSTVHSSISEGKMFVYDEVRTRYPVSN